MKIYIVDDDISIVNLLKIIITERNLGKICGITYNGEDALDDICSIKPDIVIADLLMPIIDGITLVKKAKKELPSTAFIMLSQVSSKDMIASAYESGIEFFIHKPINSLEVESIIKKVSKNLSLERAFEKMNNILSNEISSESNMTIKSNYDTINNTSIEKSEKNIRILKNILHRLGIIGEIGSKDIIDFVLYMIDNANISNNLSLSEVCQNLSSSPKSFEQRIRRTAYTGLVNIANLGIEDYGNDTFVEFSNSLYNFEQVKKEMDFIRGKSKIHGKVSIRSFLNALSYYCK